MSMDVRRVRTVKRRKEEKAAEKNRIHLERVLGLTILSNAGLSCSPTTGTIAYSAGCTIVLYNARKNRQAHITNPSRKTFTTLDFSDGGHFLVTGECGHQPHVRVWDVHDRSLVCEFPPGHKYGINCVSFAPNDKKYVVSVGSQHDMIVNVWDWRSKGNNSSVSGGIGNQVCNKVASNKISAKVKAVSFAENGSYFVTAGNRHVKYWYLEYSRSKYQEPTTPLTGRSAILGEQRNNYFCDVACGRGEMGDSTFAITKSGLLCEFNNRRLLDKWVELRTSGANCLSVGEDFIFIGCADGIVRCFSPHSLQFVTTLPRTHFLGVDVSKGLTISHMASHPSNAKYPDATAVTFDKSNLKVTVIYNDHSIYMWDVRDIGKVGKSHSFLFHSACIWGLEMYPQNSSGSSVLPPGSFITCSSDDTVRIWNTTTCNNIYSDELLKVIYVDDELEFIKNIDSCKTDADKDVGSGSSNCNTVYDQRNGVRCIRVSPDGQHLASGDRAGNVRIHELQFMDELCKIEAHDAEVLCLEYSDSLQVPGCSSNRTKSILASASRDRLIHVFNGNRDYGFQHTLDDHSSSITAIKFLKSSPSSLQMVSCGADKSIIFRDVSLDGKGQVEFQRVNHTVGKTTLYDMEVDYENQRVLTACQDRNIRVYNLDSGKHSKTFKGSQSDDGTLIKVVLDESGTYAATSCTDKTLAIYDYAAGEVAATMFGHSELVTGLRFTKDCRHLISVSGDSCIFIWRLPVSMTAEMLNKLSQRKENNDDRIAAATTTTIIEQADRGNNEGDYSFNLGQLPVWAKKKMGEDGSSGIVDKQNTTKAPMGRWGQRVGGGSRDSDLDSHGTTTAGKTEEGSSLEVGQTLPGRKALVKEDFLNDEDYNSMSEIESNNRPSCSPFPPTKAGNGKSIGRTTQQQQLKLLANDADSSLGSLNVESTAEHDGDIDEYSDAGLTGGESTEPEHPFKTLFFRDIQTPVTDYPVNAVKGDVKSESEDDDYDEGESMPNKDFVVSNFDSLGGEEERKKAAPCFDTISNRYREGSAVRRNAATIARAQSFRDSEQNERRQLLQKRIEETRRKLQEIGYRSMMRGSQSISDLTNATDTSQFMKQQTWLQPSLGFVSRPTSTEPPNAKKTQSVDQVPGDGGGLRRVCSLSDLTQQSSQRRLLPAPPISVSGKKSAHGPSRRLSSKTDNNCSSELMMMPSYMRSTSSSTRKERAPAQITPLGGTRTTKSTVEFRRPESSSEEEEDSAACSGDSRRRWSERDLTKVTKVKGQSQNRPKMKTTTMIVSGSDHHQRRQQQQLSDVFYEPLDWALVERTKASLEEAADNLVQLYKRISLDPSLREDVRDAFLQNLAGVASETTNITLRPVANPLKSSLTKTKVTINKGPSWC